MVGKVQAGTLNKRRQGFVQTELESRGVTTVSECAPCSRRAAMGQMSSVYTMCLPAPCAGNRDGHKVMQMDAKGGDRAPYTLTVGKLI